MPRPCRRAKATAALDTTRSDTYYHAGRIRRPATTWRSYPMAWKRPKIREVCIGMEINGYFPGEL
jgi:coenzyme PQQ precursor peptide PqqA